MYYSTVRKSGNVAGHHYDSKSLLRFAYNHARSFFWDNLQSTAEAPHQLLVPLTPIIFLYYLVAAPFIYREEGDPPFKRQVSTGGLEARL